MKRTWILFNKLPVYLMYEFWYDYLKPKYEEKVELCYIDTGSFIVYIKTEDIYVDIYVEMIFQIIN